MKFNDDLQRVQVGQYNKVPIEDSKLLWFLWITNGGDWDSELITRPKNILKVLDTGTNYKTDVDKIFCVWHGEYRTNLFLMDKEDLIKRLRKLI